MHICACHSQAFSRGCAAKLVLQTAGGAVFSTEEESRAHLEQTCAGVLNGTRTHSQFILTVPHHHHHHHVCPE